MEDQTAPPSPQTESPTSPQAQKKAPLILVGALALVILGAGFFAWQTNPSKQLTFDITPLSSPTNGIQMPVQNSQALLQFQPLEGSTSSGFGFTAPGGMYLISVDPENPQTTKIDDGTETSTVTVSLGESGVATSLDGKYLAYQTKDNRLTLLTTDGTQKIVLPPQLRVSAVGPWSPDSKRLIVHSSPGTIPDLFEGMGLSEETVTFEKGLLPQGYYLVDVEAGTVVPLTPISSFLGWVDKSRILTSLSDSNIDNQTFMIFDVDQFTAETENLLPSSDTFFSVQKTINEDGSKWALTVWPQGEDTNAIYTFIADFPQTSGGKVIANGIRSQNPLISADGKSVLIHTQDEQNGPRYVEFWRDDQITRVGKGIPLRWIDNDHFIYSEMSEELSTNTGNHLKRVLLHNTINGQNQELFSL